ncbi:MAG: PP2C family protein-serine/threonine phosphatase [Terracidiphilus sp.]
MRKLPLLILLLCSLACGTSGATPAPAGVTQWRSGLIEINDDWAAHEGDNMAWAAPGFDDSGWQTVDLEDMGSAQPGWHWYRKHVTVGPDYPEVRLLIAGGVGTYELYVNGHRMEGPGILPSLALNRPVERVFTLDDENGDFEIAFRTHATGGYVAYGFPLFLTATMGRPTVIEYERQALESERLYAVAPTVAINLLLVLAALGSLALFASQRTQRDYLFLAIFLLLTGVSNALWHLQQHGVGPISLNFLIADPMVYLVSIAQIEFTLSFARRRIGIGWRLYEVLLLLPPLLVPAVWLGHVSQDTYNLVEAGVTAPAALLLPAFLAYWFRRGNREAGLLILPSLVPTAMGVLYNLGLVSLHLGWRYFGGLIEPIQIGVFPVQISDAGSMVFLVAIGVVMFFRFTRVSREQARAAAELGAAREIQQRLVPASLPELVGFHVEAAYLPAQEVGGDFYQVLQQADGFALIVVGDVSGKGLKAAMTGALAIGALRTLAAENLGPAALMKRLNRQMLATQESGFITCLCLRVSREGVVTMANAGHLSPYRGGVEIVLDSGLPLGLAAGVVYGETVIELKVGDRLTLLSDGVVEAMNAQHELFGFERTREISAQSVDAIAAAAQAFGQEDDITVVTVERSRLQMTGYR